MAEITVVGSINIDIAALADRYPNRGETMFGKRMEVLPGGKGANQATACARLGSSVHMIGSIGKDLYGDIILESLKKSNVDTSFVKQVEESSTGCAIITIDSTAENTMLVFKGANEDLNVTDINQAFSKIEGSNVLLVQMEIPEEVVIESMIQARKKGMFVILDPAPAEGITVRALEYADLIVPNRQETKQLTNIDVTSVDTALKAAKYFESMGVKNSIIKMAEKGSLVYQNGRLEFVPSIPVKALDTVGAGDSFAGALACAIAEGEDLVSAVKFASIVGALKVTKLGAQVGIPNLEEVNKFCEERNISYYKLNKSRSPQV
ncbi:ribokinase [Peribacillus glennii]|uniref:Ribokinase n=1 Tax=Peribacillus glennii TaxID=2303991 RepID=A0A372LFW3_9BACI|nr:ribokinase [Peribacillus glennii]RFU65185.1 ribokinase [Peribacillus glennii]